jgi:pyruvate dehydrogenase E1 component alpha subunit
MSAVEARHPASFKMGDIVRGLGGVLVYVDGNDVQHVDACMRHALRHMKETEKPYVLQCATYRHMAHSAPLMDDKAGYRKVDDLKTRLAACPLKKFTDKYFIGPEIFDVIKSEILQEIEEAIYFAETSPMPDPEDLIKGVYHE